MTAPPRIEPRVGSGGGHQNAPPAPPPAPPLPPLWSVPSLERAGSAEAKKPCFRCRFDAHHTVSCGAPPPPTRTGAARGVCGVRRSTFCRFPLFASHRFRPSLSPRKKPRLSVPTGNCSRAEATPFLLLCLATRHVVHVVASSLRVLGTRVLRRSSANRLNYHVPIASRKYSRPRAEAQNSLLAAASSRRFPQKGNFTGTTTT